MVQEEDSPGLRGVATSVDQQYADSALGAGEGAKEEEYVITRLECFNPALNVVNCYGEQRKCTQPEARLRLKQELEAIRARKEFCLIGGDLNKLVGNDELGVPGNDQHTSPGGKLLRTLLATRHRNLGQHSLFPCHSTSHRSHGT